MLLIITSTDDELLMIVNIIDICPSVHHDPVPFRCQRGVPL